MTGEIWLSGAVTRDGFEKSRSSFFVVESARFLWRVWRIEPSPHAPRYIQSFTYSIAANDSVLIRHVKLEGRARETTRGAPGACYKRTASERRHFTVRAEDSSSPKPLTGAEGTTALQASHSLATPAFQNAGKPVARQSAWQMLSPSH